MKKKNQELDNAIIIMIIITKMKIENNSDNSSTKNQ